MQDGKEMWNTAEAGEDEPLALQHLQTLRAHTEKMLSILGLPRGARVAA